MDRGPNSQPSAKWVGYELHDGLLQWLVGARMMLEAKLDRPANKDAVASQRMGSPETEVDTASVEIRALLESTMLSLGAAIDEGRALITFLEQHAEHLAFDIQQAIEDFLEFLPRHTTDGEISLQFERLDQPLTLAPDVGWNVLRIVQQAIRNAIFHSGASVVRVSVTAQSGSTGNYFVSIHDDGCGFDVDSAIARSARANHFGLASMQHRAQQLGGELAIKSETGRGSQVVFSFPGT